MKPQASAESDHGHCCLLKDYMNTVECAKGEQMLDRTAWRGWLSLAFTVHILLSKTHFYGLTCIIKS